MSLLPLLVSAVALPATAFVIRSLGPTQYGQWATSLALVMLAMLFCNLGLRGTFVRDAVRRPEFAGTLLAEQLGLRLSLCLPAGIAAVATCLALSYPPLVVTCTAIAVLWMTLTVVSTTAADLLQAKNRLASVAAVNAVYGLLLTAISALVATLGAGPVGIACSHVVAAGASATMMLRLVAKEGVTIGASVQYKRALEMLWAGRHFGAQLLLNNAANQVEHLLVPRLLGTTSFGYFAAGALLSTRLQALPDGAATAAFSAVADLDRREGRRAASRTCLKFLLGTVTVCVCTSAGITFLVRPISEVIFPGSGELCAQVMMVTIWALPLAALVSILGSTLNALGWDAAQARVSLVASGCHLVLAAVLIWRFGIVGASWSVVAQEAIWLMLLAPSVMSAFNWMPDRRL